MVDLVRCKQQIANLDQQQPALKASLSKLTRQARGEEKADCLTSFGSVGEVQKFLLNPGDIDLLNSEEHNAPQNEQIQQETTTQLDENRTTMIQTQAWEWAQIGIWVI